MYKSNASRATTPILFEFTREPSAIDMPGKSELCNAQGDEIQKYKEEKRKLDARYKIATFFLNRNMTQQNEIYCNEEKRNLDARYKIATFILERKVKQHKEISIEEFIVRRKENELEFITSTSIDCASKNGATSIHGFFNTIEETGTNLSSKNPTSTLCQASSTKLLV